MQIGSTHPLRVIPEGVLLNSVEIKQGCVQNLVEVLVILYLL